MKVNHRLEELRTASKLLTELDDEYGGQGENHINRIRSDLQQAGANVTNSNFDRHMTKALGRLAGMAIAAGQHELADRATRVMDGEADDE